MKKKNKTHRQAKCNGNRLVFSSLKDKNIFADFNGGQLTSDVGLLALREVDKQIGLTEQLAQCIVDNRHPGYVKHSILQMLRQRIYAIAAGYEDLNDHQTLRNDPVIQAVAEHLDKGALASAPTLCRLENNIDREAYRKFLKFLSNGLSLHINSRRQRWYLILTQQMIRYTVARLVASFTVIMTVIAFYRCMFFAVVNCLSLICVLQR